ncbi:MAG TPA: hypothetical protein VJS85_08475 [Rhizomicrobium sp.]|nr:hypothetical protein [Rhizomicrobium sp.]
MRLLVFALLAIAISVGVQLGFDQLPYTISPAMHGIDTALFFLSPVIVAAGLAYVMRVWNWYAFFLVVLLPFVSFAIFAYIRMAFLHDHLL